MMGMSGAVPQGSVTPALENSTPLTPQASKHPTIRRTFASLQHRNYRLWFFGQMVSLAGTWMQTTAQGYLIYQLTHSPAYLGLVAFAAGIPAWLFTLYGGVVADRMSRRNLLVITQTTMMVLAFILAPTFEASLRRSLIMSQGSFSIFLDRPVAAISLLIAGLLLLSLFFPVLKKLRRRVEL